MSDSSRVRVTSGRKKYYSVTRNIIADRVKKDPRARDNTLRRISKLSLFGTLKGTTRTDVSPSSELDRDAISPRDRAIRQRSEIPRTCDKVGDINPWNSRLPRTDDFGFDRSETDRSFGNSLDRHASPRSMPDDAQCARY